MEKSYYERVLELERTMSIEEACNSVTNSNKSFSHHGFNWERYRAILIGELINEGYSLKRITILARVDMNTLKEICKKEGFKPISFKTVITPECTMLVNNLLSNGVSVKEISDMLCITQFEVTSRAKLFKRFKQVIELLKENHSIKEIASITGLNEVTIENIMVSQRDTDEIVRLVQSGCTIKMVAKKLKKKEQFIRDVCSNRGLVVDKQSSLMLFKKGYTIPEIARLTNMNVTCVSNLMR